MRGLAQAAHDLVGDFARLQPLGIVGMRTRPDAGLPRLDGERLAGGARLEHAMLDVETGIADRGDATLDDNVVAVARRKIEFGARVNHRDADDVEGGTQLL